MKQYWMRIAGAWFLLSLAGRVMKSAEKVLQAAQESPTPETITEPTDNHHVDSVTPYVEARYDG